MPTFLYTADLHLTSRPVDRYRWRIFDTLNDSIDRYNLDAIFILGDITDIKDNHSSALVNQIANAVKALVAKVPVYILKGNHDYQDVNEPFFGFLDHIDGVHFIKVVTDAEIGGLRCIFLPHTKSWRGDWENLKWSKYDRIYTHQCYNGSLGASGTSLDGTPPAIFDTTRTDALVIAGDVHVPQWVGRVCYCGSPHPIHFGDTFQPRILIDLDGDLKSIKQVTIQKLMVSISGLEDLAKLAIYPEDQLKVTINLPRYRFCEWEDIKKKIQDWSVKNQLVLAGIELKEKVRLKLNETHIAASPAVIAADTLRRFCEARNVDERLAAVGEKLVGGVQ